MSEKYIVVTDFKIKKRFVTFEEEFKRPMTEEEKEFCKEFAERFMSRELKRFLYNEGVL